MDSAVPDTTLTLYGQKFQTPIATAALSHLGTFYPDSPNGMVHYARGALKSGAVHFVGMSEMEEYDAIAKTGAACIRIIKPYADEEEIFRAFRRRSRPARWPWAWILTICSTARGTTICAWANRCA